MRDCLEISTTPCGEDCAQVGSEDYFEKYRPEAKRYIALLEKIFGNPPEGSGFSIKSFPHDFGTYHEVVVYFDDEYPESLQYAYCVEANLPETWDEDSPIDWRNFSNSNEEDEDCGEGVTFGLQAIC